MKKHEISEISKEIVKKQKDILSNLNKESVDVYLFLKKEYKKGNINKNLLFQFIFRSYYRLDNAGLSDELKKRFFELLAKKEQNLTKILLELYKIRTLNNKNSIQFSFATKLLHTIDNNKPISDTEVLRVVKKNVYGKGKGKIKSCLNLYEILESSYIVLLQDKQIKKVMLKFRNRFDISKNEISDVKVLDFILWSLGKLKKKKKKVHK